MDEQKRDFKGIWIPRGVWLDKRLSINEKFYLSIYIAEKDIRRTDAIMKKMVSQTTLVKTKNKLYNLNLLKSIINPEEAKKFVINNKHNGLVCEWCGENSYILEQHHFPILKCDGGKDIVSICPTCHAIYHNILKRNYE